MGTLFHVVVFPTFLYQGWIQSLAPHDPIVEGDEKNTGTFLSPSIPKDIHLNMWWNTKVFALTSP
jgi:hypothetical protein